MSYLDDPRVFFAAERTLLAWIRTGLGLSALGLAISRYQLFLATFRNESMDIAKTHPSFYLGMAIIFIAFLAVIVPTIQFGRFIRSMDKKEYPPRYSVYASVYMGAIMGLMVLALLTFLILE